MINLTYIYLVRHCEALGNLRRLFQGTTDLDITDLGAKQLTYLTKRFRNEEFDKVYSSPLIRTVKTAKAVIGSRDMEPIICNGLIELDGGFLEGKPFLETFDAHPELKDAWFNHPQDFAPEGGETMPHAYERGWNTVLSLAKENPGKRIVCATHGGLMRCITCKIMLDDISQLNTIPLNSNTAVTLIEFDDNLKPRIVYLNDSAHLPDDMVTRFAEKKETEES